MLVAKFIICCLVGMLSYGALDAWGTAERPRAVEDHIRIYYPKLAKALEMFGFVGPFGEELARYALVRQLHEDGLSRSEAKSIVGLWPGCWNKEVMDRLAPHLEAQGLQLNWVRTGDGGKSYVIYGPLANVWSGVAIALVWEKYLDVFSIDKELKDAWKESHSISRRIAEDLASQLEYDRYYNLLRTPRRKVLESVNRKYNADQAGRLNQLVIALDKAFTEALSALRQGNDGSH